MKGIIFAIATVAATAIGVTAVAEISSKGRKAITEKTVDDAWDSRTDEEVKNFEHLEECKTLQHELYSREAKEEQQLIDEYKKSINYAEVKNDIENLREKKIKDFTDSIGYERLKTEYKKEYDTSLAEWKKTNDYAVRIEREERRKDDADKLATSQKLFSTLASDSSEQAKEVDEKLKDVINDAKKKVKDDANKNIKKIEEEYEDYKKSQKKIYDSKIDDLNKQVSEVRTEANKAASADLSKLENKVNDRRREISKSLKEKRSDDENRIEEEIEKYSKKTRDTQSRLNKEIDKKLKNMKATDVAAAYFAEKKWSKFGVLSLLILPLIPVVAIGAWWVKFVSNIISKL